MLSRRSFLKGLLGGTLAGFFMGGYAFAEASFRLRVRHWQIEPPLWPRGQRLRIAMLADLHAANPGMRPARVQRIVDAVNAQGADLIALMGDYRASHRFQTGRVEITEIAPILAGLSAPLGVFAVTGNHDWWDDPEALRRRMGPTRVQRALEAVGIWVLANEALRLGQGENAFWLGGVESQMAFYKTDPRDQVGMSDVPGVEALMADTAPAVLLAHEPDLFPTVSDRVALTLSGHTHGGQIRFGPWAPVVPSRFGTRYAYGHIREGRRDLVVSGGLGCSGLPLRLGSPPEITVVDLA